MQTDLLCDCFYIRIQTEFFSAMLKKTYPLDLFKMCIVENLFTTKCIFQLQGSSRCFALHKLRFRTSVVQSGSCVVQFYVC